MSELPKGWAMTLIGSISKKPSQRIPEAAERFRYIDIGSIDRIAKAIVNSPEISGKDAPSRARQVVERGDVLVSMTRPNLNAVAVVPAEFHGHVASTGFDVLRPTAVESRWLFAAVRSRGFVDAMSDLVQGALYPAVRSSDIRAYSIPLPPLPEQKRIADKLDALIARVDAARERLDRVPAILRRFRQAVLAAATNGELTADWRLVRGESDEWSEVSLSEIGDFGRGKSKHRPRNDPRLYGGPYPFIQTGDVAASGGMITTHSQTYSEFGLVQSKLWPEGTLCITIAANIADTAILQYPACFPDSVVGFVADQRKCVALFIKWAIDVVQADLESFAPATAQKNINLGVLSEVRIMLPPLDEQREIVRRVESLFAIADRLQARYDGVQALVDRLAPALLAKAFCGDLVSQDPGDEPADELLERLHAGVVKSPETVRKSRKAPRPASV